MNFNIIFQKTLAILYKIVYTRVVKNEYVLQGRVQFPTGGTAHEPKGMTWCDSMADSIVWMREEV